MPTRLDNPVLWVEHYVGHEVVFVEAYFLSLAGHVWRMTA